MSTGDDKKPLQINAGARVEVTVEVMCGPWGADCTVEQIYRQASREAVDEIRRQIGPTRLRVVGEPRVVAVLTEEKR